MIGNRRLIAWCLTAIALLLVISSFTSRGTGLFGLGLLTGPVVVGVLFVLLVAGLGLLVAAHQARSSTDGG